MNAALKPEANIRERIVEKRKERIAREGYGLGVDIPAGRGVPISAFTQEPLVICEIKRRSPSRGDISPGLDPVEQAGKYVEAGIKSVSVLTEEDFFGGSLKDLMAVKAAFPGLSVLRKDFLIDEHDVLVSYRAGADAILLIASMLEHDLLAAMLKRAESLGMTALVEVHSKEEIEKIRDICPRLVGINSRDLETFRIDRLLPLGLRPRIDWDSMVVFESGIFGYEDALYTRMHHFQGILVGEAVVKKPHIIPELIHGVKALGLAGLSGLDVPAAIHPRPWRFWQSVAEMTGSRPLVKICGIAREEDGRLAAELGADVLGFIFAESPRRSNEALVRALSGLEVLKVAVVVNDIPAEVTRLIAEGLIDAVQLHGDESPEVCIQKAWPYYKALRPKTEGDLSAIESYRCPRVLLDAYSAESYGGTGKRLNENIVRAAAEKNVLWLAGGINADNVAEIVTKFRPELVDSSSGLESEPGKKDPVKMKRFFQEIANVCIQ